MEYNLIHFQVFTYFYRIFNRIIKWYHNLIFKRMTRWNIWLCIIFRTSIFFLILNLILYHKTLWYYWNRWTHNTFLIIKEKNMIRCYFVFYRSLITRIFRKNTITQQGSVFQLSYSVPKCTRIWRVLRARRYPAHLIAYSRNESISNARRLFDIQGHC